MQQVFMVHHGDVDQSLRNLKKVMQKEGISPNRRAYYEKPSDIRRKKRSEAMRRMSRNSN